MTKTVIFSHGKESGPNGTKIQLLSEVALRKGHTVRSIDYRKCKDAAARVGLLKEILEEYDAASVILVGSSMGGYVSLMAAHAYLPAAMFLMCPAAYLPGYDLPEPLRYSGNMEIIHGYEDEIVPYEHSIRLSKESGAVLTLLRADHRLSQIHGQLKKRFECFLSGVE